MDSGRTPREIGGLKPETLGDHVEETPRPTDLDTYLELVDEQEIDFCWVELLFWETCYGS